MEPPKIPAAIRVALAGLLVAAGIGLHLAVPELPRFLALLPAVLVASFLGGRWLGGGALAVSALFALFDPSRENAPHLAAWELIGLACFLAAGALAVALMDLHHKTVVRLSRERQRLRAALAAANAAVWELPPEGRLFWDENFYRLVGLEPGSTPPSTPTFLAMVHPDDRARMAEARRLMDERVEPRRSTNTG